MVGIANCPSGYDEALIDYLQPFLATCSNLIQSHRDYKLRQEAEGALRESQEMLRRANEDLENRVKQRTQQLQEAKLAADSANKAKSEFLANMSHELRTPLNGILGYTQILHRSQLTEDGRKGVDIIHQCASHLLTLINDVLDLSKIEAQKMEIYPVDFHFPSFLEGVTEICRIRAEQKDIAFIYQPDTQIPIGIKADEKRLRQVLINLLGNAIKFTDFGEVTFRVKTAFNEAASRYKIRFEIEDTGVGMAPEQLEKIFLPFEQVGESVKQSEGTGLGLAISGKIISLMDSKIEVQSELGKGSIFAFEVELPKALNWTQSSKLSKRGAIIGYEGNRQKVLVVDDKWENRSVIVKLLESLGFEIAEAQNGHQGLEKAIEFQPNIIITDLVMPVMHGFEFMKNLRALPEFEKVVIIASSASVFDTDQYKSLDAGAAAFLSKPISADALFEMLSKHLEIEWLYQHNSEQSTQNKTNTTSPNQIAIPSQEVLEYLYEIARKGNIKKISFEAEKLKEATETLRPFADKIINLSEKYQIKLIRDFLKGLLDN
ncbi:MAG: response regulator [Calothrix sp. FI2-JRJ7]|nr:response regulator [Calothrix sp. FI2-JRJ7]